MSQSQEAAAAATSCGKLAKGDKDVNTRTNSESRSRETQFTAILAVLFT